MNQIEQMLMDDAVKEEYRRAFLLNVFRKLCSKMQKNNSVRDEIRVLFRQTYDPTNTTKLIVRKYIGCDLDDIESAMIEKWIRAHFNKNNRRMPISNNTKERLFAIQQGCCRLCGEPLGKDWSMIHVDHIIPWSLVGDELDDNYQLLCSTCNESKSASTDYVFKQLLKLN